MATSNAERQAAYRVRHLKSEEGQGERLNLIIGLHAKRSLERLASCYGVTQKGMLERIILDAERATLDTASPAGQEEYYNGSLRLDLLDVTR